MLENLLPEEDPGPPLEVRLRQESLVHVPALLQAIQARIHPAQAHEAHSQSGNRKSAPESSQKSSVNIPLTGRYIFFFVVVLVVALCKRAVLCVFRAMY